MQINYYVICESVNWTTSNGLIRHLLDFQCEILRQTYAGGFVLNDIKNGTKVESFLQENHYRYLTKNFESIKNLSIFLL